MVLDSSGVSLRDSQFCLEQMLGVQPSLGWLSQPLDVLALRAAHQNASWTPSIGEGLAGDEIFSQGHPNLLVVGNESLYVYALTRQAHRDGETWACVLMDSPSTEHFARDGGTGLSAGTALTQTPDQLDWWHLLHALWQIDSSLERKAYGALGHLFERESQFGQSHTPKRLQQHLNQWEKLAVQVRDRLKAYDDYHRLALEVHHLFEMIDMSTGRLVAPEERRLRLRTLGEQIHALGGRACQSLGKTLMGQAEVLVAYLPRVAEALQPLQQQWGHEAIAHLCCLWQVEERLRRGHVTWQERQQLEHLWNECLDQAAESLGEPLFQAWEALVAVLGRNWRSCSAAECVNSLLRKQFNAHRHTDQKRLELIRFVHNTHTFQREKRQGSSPAQLVGIQLPQDPFTLLGLQPKQQTQPLRKVA